MEFRLNGDEQVFEGDPKLPLLTYLREEAGICSAKDGCAPQAACGTCTVQLGAKAVLACVTPMKKVADKCVTTTEGLEAQLQQTFATAFLDLHLKGVEDMRSYLDVPEDGASAGQGGWSGFSGRSAVGLRMYRD